MTTDATPDEIQVLHDLRAEIGEDITVRIEWPKGVLRNEDEFYVTLKEKNGPAIKVKAKKLEEAITRLKTILAAMPSDDDGS